MTDFNSTLTDADDPEAPRREPSPEPAGPIPENGSGDGRRPDGTFAPGNQVARQHGLYAARQPAGLLADVERFTGHVVTDLGGESELSAAAV